MRGSAKSSYNHDNKSFVSHNSHLPRNGNTQNRTTDMQNRRVVRTEYDKNKYDGNAFAVYGYDYRKTNNQKVRFETVTRENSRGIKLRVEYIGFFSTIILPIRLPPR